MAHRSGCAWWTGFGRRLRTGNHCRSACQHPVPVALALHELRRDRCGSRLGLRRGLCRNGFPRRRAHSPSAANAPAFVSMADTDHWAGENSSQPGGLRAGSPPSPPPHLIRPSVRRLLRSPRFGSGSPSSKEGQLPNYSVSILLASVVDAGCTRPATIWRNSPRISPWFLSR